MTFKLSYITVILLVGGCASVVVGRYQSIQIAADCNGIPVEASCSLRNENGSWKTNTPNNIIIQKGFGDLSITCNSQSFDTHVAYYKSSSTFTNYANAVFGGVVGFVVDTNNGAGFNYPEKINFSVDSCKSFK